MNKNQNNMYWIIPAGGSGSRMGYEKNKLFTEICGISVLARTLIVLEKSPYVTAIIMAARACDTAAFWEIAKKYRITKLKTIVGGGNTRAQSVQNALSAIPDNVRWIAVHDAARPFLTNDLIARTAEGAFAHGACACGVPLKSSVKQIGENKTITATIPRESLTEIQTPQIFRGTDLRRAYNTDTETLCTATDDCALVEKTGKKIFVCDGSYTNIKVTTPDDLIFAQAIVRAQIPIQSNIG